MGVFAEWQPIYADLGIPTFPVDGESKKPLVRNNLRGGAPASAEWAQKHPHASALGFACGKASGLTILDVDSANEKVLADAMAKLGRSPLIVRTASRKFHAYYRHDGEKRSTRVTAREWGLEGPIDILGQGGMALASPSRNSLGSYELIEGNFGDLPSLPRMRKIAPPITSDVASGAAHGEGERNSRLFDACRHAAAKCQSHEPLLAFARNLNASGEWSPLPDGEVERLAANVWRMQAEGRNGVAGGNYMILTHSALAILETNPDGLYIYNQLKRHHWGRDFYIANVWAEHLPCGKWTVRRLRAARQFLLDSGLIVRVRAFKKGQAALYRFADCI